MARPKIGKRGARSRKSKYSGKALNQELSTALSGPGSKADAALYFEDKATKLSRKALARKMREEEDRREEELRKKPITSKTEAALLRKSKRTPASSASTSAGTKGKGKNGESAVADLWGDEDVKVGRKARQALYGRDKKANIVPVLRTPSEGASYNPELEAYRSSLAKTVDAAIDFDESLHAYSKPAGFADGMERRAVAKRGRAALGRSHNDEDSNDDDNDMSSSESEGSDSEDEETKDGDEANTGNKKKKKGKRELAPGERVTRRERNRAKRRRQLELQLSQKRQKSSLLKKLDRVDDINADVDTLEADAAAKAAERAQREALKAASEPLPLINNKPVNRRPLIDTALPSDLSGTLREIKPHRDLALERFYSLHQRNKMEIGDPKLRTSRKPKARVKHVPVGKPFVEEDYDHRVDGKKKHKRFMRRGKVNIA